MKLNKAQQVALKRVYSREHNPVPYLQFRRRCLPAFGMDCVMIQVNSGMWLGIETDGYTHS
jgi:hypothetical protein